MFFVCHPVDIDLQYVEGVFVLVVAVCGAGGRLGGCGVGMRWLCLYECEWVVLVGVCWAEPSVCVLGSVDVGALFVYPVGCNMVASV